MQNFLPSSPASPRSTVAGFTVRSPRFKTLASAITLVMSLTLASGLTIAKETPDTMDDIVNDYLISGLVFFKHDNSTHLYIGEPVFKDAVAARTDDLATITAEMTVLKERLAQLPAANTPLEQKRRRDLNDRLTAFETRGQILMGHPPASFDEETRLEFGVVVPHQDEAHFEKLAAQLETLVPGDAPLEQRLEAFRDQFVIPPDRLEIVIGTAMEECRRRTKKHLELPANEYVSLHIARNQPWVGFTFYKGNSHSEIHLNADVPVHIERAIELGCHEGYPGHHVHATLLEQELINNRGWEEYRLIGLFGPQAVVAEGAASHAIDLAFTPEERLAFERDKLLPLAGLSAERLEDYYRYVDLIEALNYARNEVAQKYLFEGMPKEQAIEWLMTYGLETRGTAAQRLNFIDALRTYVVTYNHGRELVKRYIESSAGDDREAQWQTFRDILLTPMMPVDLVSTTHAH